MSSILTTVKDYVARAKTALIDAPRQKQENDMMARGKEASMTKFKSPKDPSATRDDVADVSNPKYQAAQTYLSRTKSTKNIAADAEENMAQEAKKHADSVLEAKTESQTLAKGKASYNARVKADLTSKYPKEKKNINESYPSN